jgi:hypothetical protein
MVPTTARKALTPNDRTNIFVDKMYLYEEILHFSGQRINDLLKYSVGSVNEMITTYRNGSSVIRPIKPRTV